MKYIERSKLPQYASVFEEKIDRGILYHRSGALKSLIESINWYIKYPQGQNIREVEERFDTWRKSDPREYAARTGDSRIVVKDFVDEMNEKAGRARPVVSHDPPAVEENRYRKFSWKGQALVLASQEPNRHHTAKKVLTGAESLGDQGISVAQIATGSKGVVGLAYAGMVGKGAIAAAALGASATGIGLIAVAGTSALVESGLSIKSAVSTQHHLSALKKLREDKQALRDQCKEILGASECRSTPFSTTSHSIIESVLDYAIKQKEWKLGKKITSSVPIAGSIPIFCMGAVRKLYKLARGRLGVERYTNAHWLASHFCRCDCPLADGIVTALYSEPEMWWLHNKCDYDAIAGFLTDKMKSK